MLNGKVRPLAAVMAVWAGIVEVLVEANLQHQWVLEAGSWLDGRVGGRGALGVVQTGMDWQNGFITVIKPPIRWFTTIHKA